MPYPVATAQVCRGGPTKQRSDKRNTSEEVAVAIFAKRTPDPSPTRKASEAGLLIEGTWYRAEPEAFVLLAGRCGLRAGA
jgi:hypothetical protein